MKKKKFHLFKNSDMMKKMIDKVGDQIVVISSSGCIAFVNNSGARGFGCRKDQLIGRSIIQFMSDSTTLSQWKKNYFNRVKAASKPVSFIVKRKSSLKRIRTMEVRAVLLKEKKEEFMLCVARDVSEKIDLQNRLETSEELYQMMTEQAADGIFTTNLNGRILFSNKAAAQMVKLRPSRVKGKLFASYVAKDSLPKTLGYFNQIKKGASVIRDELNIKDKNGKNYPVECTISPIFQEKGITQIHVIIRDISSRRQIERLTRDTAKMKALQNFITGTTQEIRNPLKILLDNSKRLVKKYENRDYEYIGYKEFKDILHTLDVMSDQIKYCYDTTNRLIEIGRKKAGLRARYCQANDIIKESLKMVEHLLEVSGTKVKLQCAFQLPLVAIMPTELNQVLVNIFTNAIQSITSKGNLRIRSVYLKKKQAVCIDCIDNGVGIPKENLERICEPFFSTKQRGLEKNSGLGLCIVYTILKSVKGDLQVTSHMSKGTRVRLLIPVYRNNKFKTKSKGK